MKSILKNTILILLIASLPATQLFAGNEDRSGQAGASELLINPWARSAGWGLSSTASARGMESSFMNIAGLAFTKKTEIVFSQTQWLKGTGINISAFGFSQRVGEAGVLGLSVMSMSFGKIEKTTVDQPEGGFGTFSPSLMNIGISYARSFSNSIYGGVNIKIISESIDDVSASGIAIDAGIEYITGENDNIRFGISLKNVGSTLSFSGDGFSIRGLVSGSDNNLTIEQRSADFELPSLLNIGAAYDFYLAKDKTHRLTVAGNYTSNSFTKDQYGIGLEYGLKNYLMLRAGYTYEDGLLDAALRTNASSGIAAGLTVQIPLSKEKGSTFAIDYSYRSTSPFDGTHSIGARINL
ncbi:MAG: PorV/PorQ family protein [Bacteroidota bacterium]